MAIKIYVWPCGQWCTEEDIEEYLRSSSDDYCTLEIPEYNFEQAAAVREYLEIYL